MMKKSLLYILCLLFSYTFQAQTKDLKGKQSIRVNGVCQMCKKRIEKAAFEVKGVRSAEWSPDNKEIELYINPKKTNLQEVEEAIAKAGHDTEHVRASKEAYESLHACCMYTRSKIAEEENEKAKAIDPK